MVKLIGESRNQVTLKGSLHQHWLRISSTLELHYLILETKDFFLHLSHQPNMVRFFFFRTDLTEMAELYRYYWPQCPIKKLPIYLSNLIYILFQSPVDHGLTSVNHTFSLSEDNPSLSIKMSTSKDIFNRFLTSASGSLLRCRMPLLLFNHLSI